MRFFVSIFLLLLNKSQFCEWWWQNVQAPEGISDEAIVGMKSVPAGVNFVPL